MRASVCITIYNEERNIGDLIDSLVSQSLKPDEIILVDGGSHDQTVKIIKHYQKKYKRTAIKLIKERCSRARGRNIGVINAKNDIVAMTDAGCIAEPDWLENLIKPFKEKKVEIVAGFYDMEIKSPIKKAFSIFLGITPRNFDHTFLPSTRSIAFRKAVWEKVGGFPERLNDTAEDTLFNVNVIRHGLNFFRVRKARVLWFMPDTLSEYSKKIFMYAYGDAKSGLWFNSAKGLSSHNVRVFTKLSFYIIATCLLFVTSIYPPLLSILTVLLVIYMFNAFRKVYQEYEDVYAGLWGILLQFTTDLYSIGGLILGSLPSSYEKRIKKSYIK